jgi:peroxiredoxin
MRWLALAAAVVVSALVVLGFARALPAAVEKELAGRENATHAACEPALRPEPRADALGATLPVEAPDFTLKDWAGRDVSLSAYRGRVVLLNFWATWCQTCVVEMPSLERLAVAERDRPFTTLAVSVDESWDPVRSFFRGGSQLTVVLDPEHAIPRRWGTEKFPETFIVDKRGRVRFYVVSDRNWAAPDVRACIRALEDE